MPKRYAISMEKLEGIEIGQLVEILDRNLFLIRVKSFMKNIEVLTPIKNMILIEGINPSLADVILGVLNYAMAHEWGRFQVEGMLTLVTAPYSEKEIEEAHQLIQNFSR